VIWVKILLESGERKMKIRRVVDIGKAKSAMQAMKIAEFLNWNVRKTTIHLPDGTVIAEKRAIVRENKRLGTDQEFLAVCSNQYRIVQNEDNAGIIDSVTHELNAVYEYAAELSSSETVLELKRVSSLWVDGLEKQVTHKIDVWNSHNRERAFRFEAYLLDPELKTYLFQKSYSRNHKSTYRDNLLETIEKKSKEMVAKIDADTGNFLLASQELGTLELSTSDMQAILKNLFVKSDNLPEKKQLEIEETRRNILTIFKMDPKLDLFRGTAWAGYLSVTLYLDSSQGDFTKAFSLPAEDWKIKDRAWDMICKVAKVSPK
jgi:hypothetical protein